MKRVYTFLSRLLGIDAAYFIKGGFWTFVGQGGRALLSGLLLIVLTQTLPQEAVGQYKFFMSVLLSLMIFSLPAMHNSVVQSVARGHDRSFLAGVKYRVIASTLGSLALVGVAAYFWHNGDGSAKYFLIGALFFPFYLSFQTTYSYLLAKREFKKSGLYLIGQLLVTNGAIFAALLLTDSLLVIISTAVISQSVSLAVVFLIVRAKYQKDIASSTEDPGLLKYTLQLTSYGFLPAITAHIDNIILLYFLGADNLALYVVAMTLPKQNLLVVDPLARVLLPKLSAVRDAPKLFKAIRKKLPLVTGLSLLVNGLGVIITPLVITLLFPPSYAPSIGYAQLGFLVFLFIYPQRVLYDFLIAQKRTKGLFKLGLYPSLLKTGLLFILVPLWGIVGAIAARALARYGEFAMTYFYASRYAQEKKDL